MKVTPSILGACAAVAVAGAAMGSTINTSPLSRSGEHWLDGIPRHAPAFAAEAEPGRVTQTPTQFALDTEEGGVGIGELATRGRFASRSELAERYERDVPADPSLAEIERIERAALAPFPQAPSPVQVTAPDTVTEARPLDPVGAAPMTLPVAAEAKPATVAAAPLGDARVIRVSSGVR